MNGIQNAYRKNENFVQNFVQEIQLYELHKETLYNGIPT
jgi:hypothetical protein